jgi:4-diphosphocytidyl-2-C-methyl-D-erythritol kinase
MRLPAFAKINWTLRVAGRRADGFHEICTIFQTVSLADYLTFELASDLILTCDAPHVPIDKSNLVWRAANALQQKFSINAGARIHLEKRIPSPGGLGGGSSDAAVALVALSHLWQIETTKSELARAGATLGADVPFFLTGGTALGTGLGNEIESLPDVPKQLLLVVTPDENVSTAEAYRALKAPVLTNEISKSILQICRFEAQNLDFLQTKLQNDFETTVFRLKPEIARVKAILLEIGAREALMSGSGASVFGIFDNEQMRRSAFEKLTQNETSWRVFLCETISRGEYQNILRPCWNFVEDSS